MNFSQAINATYYKDIAAYSATLVAKSDADINPAFEVTQIMLIHKECALASAQATISASLTPQPSGETNENSWTVTVVALPAVGGAAAFSGTTSAAAETVSYQVNANDKIEDVVQGLKAKMQQSGLAKLGVTVADAATPANSFLLQAPKSLNVIWAPTDANVTVVPQKGGGAAPAAQKTGRSMLTYPGHPVN